MAWGPDTGWLKDRQPHRGGRAASATSGPAHGAALGVSICRGGYGLWGPLLGAGIGTESEDDPAVGVATIERAVGVLRAICELAVEDKRLAANPAVNVKLPRREHPDRAYLTVEQVRRLADACAFRPEVVHFLGLTGLWWVNVSRSVTEVRGKLVWGTPKTHERRSVPFPAALSEELAALMVGKVREDLVFTAENGGVLRNGTYGPRVFDKAVEKCQKDAAKVRAEEAKGGDVTTWSSLARVRTTCGTLPPRWRSAPGRM